MEIALEEPDRAIAEVVRRGGDGGSRAEVPNLLPSELWRNEDFNLKVLGGRSGVLSAVQVLIIRICPPVASRHRRYSRWWARATLSSSTHRRTARLAEGFL